MKAIFFTKNPEHFKELLERIQKNFIGFIIDIIHQESEVTNKILNEPGFVIYMVDLGVGEHAVKNFFYQLEELSQDKPIISLGKEENLKDLSKTLLLKNPKNAIASDYSNYPKMIELLQLALQNSSSDQQKEMVIEQDQEDNLIKIKLRNMFFYESFPHDCYIKISDKRYVLGLEADEKITEKDIIRHLNRGIKFFYVEKDKHIKFLEKSMQKAVKFFRESNKLSRRNTMAHLRSLAVIHDYLIYLAVTPDIEKFLHEVCDNIIECLEGCLRPSDAFVKFPFQLQSVVGKSLIACYLNFFLMKAMGWHALSILKRFTVAAFLQDIFIDNDRMSSLKSLEDPDIIDFREEEILAFKQHHQKASELAEHLHDFTEISFLIFNHHELPNRRGFPNKPSPAEMQLATCLFNVGCHFAAEIDGQKMNQDSLKILARDYQQNFSNGNFKEPVSKLVELFKT